jgi:hypothetical protein
VNASTLAKLEADAHWSNPSPVVTLDAVVLRRLLEEREAMLGACSEVLAAHNGGSGRAVGQVMGMVRAAVIKALGDAVVKALEP